jgi:hypothetical protein
MKVTKLLVSMAVTAVFLAAMGGAADVAYEKDFGESPMSAPQWISLVGPESEGDQPTITATSYDQTGMRVAFSLPGFYIETIEIEGQGKFQRITFPGQGYLGEEGKPDLPMKRFLFSIPGTTDLRVVVNEVEYVDHILEEKDFPVKPIQRFLLEKEKTSTFTMDEETYNKDAFNPDPADSVTVSIAGIVHGVRLGMLKISPFLYNPVSGVLRVAKNITLKVEFTGENTKDDPVYYATSVIPPQLKRTLKKHLLNYELAAPSFPAYLPADLDCGIDYLIIADPALYNSASLQYLKNYHESQGLSVEIVNVSTIGTTANQIKAYIQAEYNSATPPDLDYVLLVADVSVIPFKHDAYSTIDSDIWYAWLDGGDMFGDVGLGRFPARNETELAIMVSKTLNHHANAYPGPWQNNVCLIAHKEQYPLKYTECKNNILNEPYNLYPPNFDTMYGGDPAAYWSNSDLTAMIEDGRGVVNYRGHGDTQEFWNWNLYGQSYLVSDVQALANGLKTPIIFSIACLNLNMDSPLETIGEAFIRHNQGAVAFLGSIHGSYTYPNHDFDECLFKCVWNDGINRIGELLNAANFDMVQIYGSTYASLANITMFLWLGDPALKVTNYWNVYNPVTHQNNYLGIACHSPAAVTSMIIDKVAGIYPADPVVPVSQPVIINFIDVYTGTSMMLSGSPAEHVQTILEQYTGNGYCTVYTNGSPSSGTCAPSPVGGSFNWALFKRSDVDEILFDIAYWQQQNQYAAAVPTEGDFCKWVVIEGVSSEVPPSQSSAAAYPLRGFFIDDPAATGGYSKTFKSAHFWKDPAEGYYLPTDGSYYEAVIEPPEISGIAVPVEPFNPQLVENINCNDYTLPLLAEMGIAQMELTKNNVFYNAYRETTPGTSIRVDRTDGKRSYYLVPFYVDKGDQVSVVVMLTEEGQFIEAAYSTDNIWLEFSIDPTKESDATTQFSWGRELGTSPYQPVKK